MSLGLLLLLAVLQGVTEFLPVSSSGHLALARAFLGAPRQGLLVELALHAGTLVAVVLLYRSDWLALLRTAGSLPGRLSRRETLPAEGRLLLLLLLGTLPAAVAGLLFHNEVETAFGSCRFVGAALLATGIVLALAARAARRAGRPLASIRAADALAVGIAQAFALLPGLSRSGVTVAAAFGRGFAPEASARLSFLLAVPATAGACALGAIEWAQGTVVPEAPPASLFFGAVLAGLVGFASLRLFLRVLARGWLPALSAYCGAVGLVALLFAPAQGGGP